MRPWFVLVVPPTMATSALPAIKLPFPSAVKLPTTLIGRALLNPLNRKAYCPLRLALLALLSTMTVTIAEADLLGSAAEAAVTVTVRGLATLTGAVYLPLASIIPQPAPVQPVPETFQVTAWLAPLGLTVEVNCCTPSG